MVAAHAHLFLSRSLNPQEIVILIAYVILLYYRSLVLEKQMMLEVHLMTPLLTRGNVCLDEYSNQGFGNLVESVVEYLELRILLNVLKMGK